jgi:hypothetical protein
VSAKLVIRLAAHFGVPLSPQLVVFEFGNSCAVREHQAWLVRRRRRRPSKSLNPCLSFMASVVFFLCVVCGESVSSPDVNREETAGRFVSSERKRTRTRRCDVREGEQRKGKADGCRGVQSQCEAPQPVGI